MDLVRIPSGSKVVARIAGKNARCVLTSNQNFPESVMIHSHDDGMNYILDPRALTLMDW